jgi:hypothetical protein
MGHTVWWRGLACESGGKEVEARPESGLRHKRLTDTDAAPASIVLMVTRAACRAPQLVVHADVVVLALAYACSYKARIDQGAAACLQSLLHSTTGIVIINVSTYTLSPRRAVPDYCHEPGFDSSAHL